MDLASPENPTPSRSRWQFSLRQMLTAITGIAILLGWAAWDQWRCSHAVTCLSIAFLASIFSRTARRVSVGACFVVLVIWMAGVLRYLTAIHFGTLLSDPDRVDPVSLCLSTLLILCFAAFLRANCRVRCWVLVGSLVLIELFVAAVILDAAGQSCTGSASFDVLRFNCAEQRDQIRADWIRDVLVDHLFKQGWYIAAPWLLGIVIGGIIVRRRKPSGRGGHEV
jgi:hypothetical protein